jgi:hypothetical protein
MRRALRWPEKLMACGMATDYLLWVQARSRSNGRHREAKAGRSAATVAVPQAATVEAAAPSGPAEMVSIVKSQLQQPGQEPRSASRLVTVRASRLCTSTCGSIT